MTKISKEEVLKIAQISHIELTEEEIPHLIEQLNEVLTYAERVTEVAAKIAEPSIKNVNVFREDVVVPADVEPVLAQAPEREGDYFVVPAILDHTE